MFTPSSHTVFKTNMPCFYPVVPPFLKRRQWVSNDRHGRCKITCYSKRAEKDRATRAGSPPGLGGNALCPPLALTSSPRKIVDVNLRSCHPCSISKHCAGCFQLDTMHDAVSSLQHSAVGAEGSVESLSRLALLRTEIQVTLRGWN